MKQYVCYYCETKSDTFECIIEHLTSQHTYNCLKYRELELNSETGATCYRTKSHGNIIPADGEIVVTSDNKVGILRNDRSKKKKLNTPCKVENENEEMLSYCEFDNQSENKNIDELLSEMDIGSQINENDYTEPCLQELVRLMPAVVEKMRQHGHLETYSKWCQMMSDDTFPMENICFRLFLDVIEWYSSCNTSQMRYIQSETRQFWEVGYRLFKGKFLRFMAGPRGISQIIKGTQEKGDCSAIESSINFAVPSIQTLGKNKLNPLFPGIFEDSIINLADRLPNNIIKIGIDGKKIARGKGDKMGDIDCWGFEKKPTLKDKERRQRCEKNKVEELFEMCRKLDIAFANNLPIAYKTKLVNEMNEILLLITKRIEDLRHVLIHLEIGLEKFLKLGECNGNNWRKSRFAPVISSLKVSKYEVTQSIRSGLHITNDICRICATLNGCEHLYSYSGVVDLSRQCNYHQLKENVPTCEYRLVKQRSDQWFDIRKAAMVTGSTCNAAAGLGQLKQQQMHFDRVVLGKEVGPSFSEEQRRNMRYGSEHEIDGIATVVSRVIPVFFPKIEYYEEGCARVANKDKSSFLVVSPDGSFRSLPPFEPVFMYENKCKVKNMFTTPVYYNIPKYYVPQLLCEMYSYSCNELLFSSWSLESTTVFHVTFDRRLWDKIWKQLVDMYGQENPKRPTKFATEIPEIRQMVERFLETNVKLIGEFPSCSVLFTPSEEQFSGGDSHTNTLGNGDLQERSDEEILSLDYVLNTLHSLQKWQDEVYAISRVPATEILMFMANDLDRLYHMEINNAHPIAYALKGSSMSNEVFGKMVEHLIEKCEEKGLNVIATASDGQWHKFGIRDTNDLPLTVFQLQKDLWKKYKSKPKSSLLSQIRNTCKVTTLDDVQFEKSTEGAVVVFGHITDKPIVVYKETPFTYSSKKSTEKDPTLTLNSTLDNENTETFDDLSAFLPERVTETLGSEGLDELHDILSESTVSKEMASIQGVPNFPIGTYLATLFENMDEGVNASVVDVDNHHKNIQQEGDIEQVGERHGNAFKNANNKGDLCPNSISIENIDESSVAVNVQVLHDAFESMYGEAFDYENHENSNSFTALTNNSQKSVTLQESTVNSSNGFIGIFQKDCINMNADSITVVPDVYTASIHDILKMLQQADEDRKSMWLKMNTDDFEKVIKRKEDACKTFLKRELIISLNFVKNRRQLKEFKFSPSWTKSKLYDSLMMALQSSDPNAENPVKHSSKRFNPEKLSKLTSKAIGKMSKDVLLISICQDKWPTYFKQWTEKSAAKKVMVDGFDIHNYFSQPKVDRNGRVRFHFTDACHILTCLRTKICTTGLSGLRKGAWEKAAKSKDTRLNVAIVLECIDKQSVAFAKRVFGQDVEQFMIANGYHSEAKFIKLVREWFEAEDDSGISSTERCLRRINFRQYLLKDVNFGRFPPQTQYIKGIPIVTYEALLVHIERKLQIYGHIPRGYNVRSLGTQEVEQFFSTMRDLDPSGLGTPKPDDIPDMMATAAWLDNIRMDPNRSFHMKTTRASVYPETILENTSTRNLEEEETHNETSLDVQSSRTSQNQRYLSSDTIVMPRDHFFDSISRTRVKSRRKSGEIAEPGKPAHRQMGVRQHHVCDDSKVLAEYRVKCPEEFYSSITEDDN